MYLNDINIDDYEVLEEPEYEYEDEENEEDVDLDDNDDWQQAQINYEADLDYHNNK